MTDATVDPSSLNPEPVEQPASLDPNDYPDAPPPDNPGDVLIDHGHDDGLNWDTWARPDMSTYQNVWPDPAPPTHDHEPPEVHTIPEVQIVGHPEPQTPSQDPPTTSPAATLNQDPPHEVAMPEVLIPGTPQPTGTPAPSPDPPGTQLPDRQDPPTTPTAPTTPAPTLQDPPTVGPTPPPGTTPEHPESDPNLIPPVPHPPDPNAPTLSDLLRPDPPKTGFEGQLAQGQPFDVTVRVRSDVDVSRVTWLNDPPVDLRHTRFEVVGDPSAHVTADERTYQLAVDPAQVMPVRDPQSRDLLGYRMRQGETMFTFDRTGRLTGAGNLEAPLQAPKVDPIDVLMIAADIGPVAGKVLSAAGEALAARAAAAFAKEGTGKFVRGPTIARFGADEVAELSRYWEGRLAKETSPESRIETERALKTLSDRGRVRDWRQSEREVAHIHEQIGGKAETAELYQDAEGAWKLTKPDFTAPNVRGEVKNWETVHIRSEDSANKLLDRLADQIRARNNLPGPANIPGRTQQTVVLDLRGQSLSEENLQTIGHVLAERTGLPVENIQLIVWAK